MSDIGGADAGARGASTPPCQRCGLVPTVTVPIRRRVGMVIAYQTIRVENPLCRRHPRELTKDFLGKTPRQGWWSIMSIFINP